MLLLIFCIIYLLYWHNNLFLFSTKIKQKINIYKFIFSPLGVKVGKLKRRMDTLYKIPRANSQGKTLLLLAFYHREFGYGTYFLDIMQENMADCCPQLCDKTTKTLVDELVIDNSIVNFNHYGKQREKKNSLE